jgi:zinc/manganese transport system ATP-binding protein
VNSLIAFDGATLGYGKHVVLRDLSFEIREGDYLGLVGPNGAGKTTVLRALLGIHSPLSGVVRRAPNLRFGYVPQRDQLNPSYPLSVADVVRMGRPPRSPWARDARRADRAAADRALAQVGLTALADRRLGNLSGGEKQRMLLARALVSEPNVLVLDEPTNGMDLGATTQILTLVRNLRLQQRLTVIFVSHALNEVANAVERIALVVEGRFRLGATREILTSEILSGMYGIQVDVEHIGGRHVVLPHPGGAVFDNTDPRTRRSETNVA